MGAAMRRALPGLIPAVVLILLCPAAAGLVLDDRWVGEMTFWQMSQDVMSVAWSPDGSTLAMAA
jgi:hypothetical protein